MNLTAYKQAQEGSGQIIRLFNPTESDQTARLWVNGICADVAFGPFEIKTLHCTAEAVRETDLMEGLLNRA